MSLWSRLERRLGDLAGELVLDDYREQLNQARSLLGNGDVQAAIDVLEALLAVKPDHGQALIVLGDARLATRDPQHAQEVYERALKLRGGDPAGLVGLGLALVSLGKYEVAVSSLTRAIAEAGGDRGILADAYRGLGVAWRRRGDLDKAMMSKRARRSAKRWSRMADRTTRRCVTSSARPGHRHHPRSRCTASGGSR